MAGSMNSMSQPIHPDRHLDVYLGNMVANRRCEIERRENDNVKLICGCPQGHEATVRLFPERSEGYAGRTIAEIEAKFGCC